MLFLRGGALRHQRHPKGLRAGCGGAVRRCAGQWGLFLASSGCFCALYEFLCVEYVGYVQVGKK